MFRSLWLRAFCAAALLFIPARSLAQTPSPTPSPSAVPEIGHVVTSDRSDETLRNAARTTYIVSKSELIRRGCRTIADAIETLPGVNIFRYGSTGALAGVALRGSTSSQVLVLIDGLPAGGAQTGTLDLNSISTSGVDRIEVVEGGGSTLYGAGSIGGIINIITKPLEGNAAIDLRTGSFGEQLIRIETAHLAYERETAANTFAYPGGTRTDADSESTSLRANFAHDSTHLRSEFSAGITDHHLGVPGSIPATFSAASRQNSVDRNVRAAFTLHHARAQTILELGGATQQELFACSNPADPNCFTPLGSVNTDSHVQASFRNTVSYDRGKLVYGVDFSRGVARIDDGGGSGSGSAVILGAPYAQSALFAQQTWDTSASTRVYGGLRAERDGNLGGILAPSAGLVTRLNPTLTLRANFATAFRAPTVEDLYYPVYSNPHLQAERERVADLRLSDAALLGGTSLTWFTSSTHNKIVTDANFIPHNVGHASISGVTAETRTKPFNHLVLRLSATDLYRAQDTDNNVRISGAGPVLSVTSELGYIGDARAPVESAGIMAINKAPQFYAFGTAPEFTRIDAYLRLRVARNALLSLRASNLGNESIAEVPGYPQPGRALSLELSTR